MGRVRSMIGRVPTSANIEKRYYGLGFLTCGGECEYATFEVEEQDKRWKGFGPAPNGVHENEHSLPELIPPIPTLFIHTTSIQ